MTTSTSSSPTLIQDGIRPVNLRADLGAIATLLEICFEDMDSSGRAAVREMRVLARSNVLLTVVQGMDRMLKGLMQGFVYMEDRQIVGNVSLYPSGYDQTWVIANVAVHPDYRRRGIAQKLCEAALQRISGWQGQAAILQVDGHNFTAQRVYQRLGFYPEASFTRWRWRGDDVPLPLPNMPDITYRSLQEWRRAFELAQYVRPTQLGWLRPTHESVFRPGVLKTLTHFLSSTTQEQWVARGQNGNIDALILTETAFGAAYMRFDMLVQPAKQGFLEELLVNYVLRHAATRYRGAITEHPADDQAAVRVFNHYGFIPERTQIHMRCKLNY